MKFYVGLHHPGDASRVQSACVSINSLRRRKKPIHCPDLMVDSGAFSELARYGRYRHGPGEYAADLGRLARIVDIEIAVAQDYMCEPFMLMKTGMTVAGHQRLTIERYDALVEESLPCPIMPVLQGYAPEDYVAHLEAYGERLKPDMRVGVGSVCKRNGSPQKVLDVVEAIAGMRPDLRLHGFGVKKTALKHPGIRALLHSADSMAWSFAARYGGRNGNDVREAVNYADAVDGIVGRRDEFWQPNLFA